MKTTKEILILALKNIRLMNDDGGKNGLCHLFKSMSLSGIITIEERINAVDYLYNNKPNSYRVKLCDSFVPDYYFWKAGQVLPRILYLIKHIIKLSKQDVKTR